MLSKDQPSGEDGQPSLLTDLVVSKRPTSSTNFWSSIDLKTSLPFEMVDSRSSATSSSDLKSVHVLGVPKRRSRFGRIRKNLPPPEPISNPTISPYSKLKFPDRDRGSPKKRGSRSSPRKKPVRSKRTGLDFSTLSVNDLRGEIKRLSLSLPKHGSGKDRKVIKWDLIQLLKSSFPRRSRNSYCRYRYQELVDEVRRLGLSMPWGTGRRFRDGERIIRRQDLLQKLGYYSRREYRYRKSDSRVDLTFWRNLAKERFRIIHRGKIGSWRELARLLSTRDHVESVGELYRGDVLTHQEAESVIRRFDLVLKYQNRRLDPNQVVLDYLGDLLDQEPIYFTSIPFFAFQSLYRSIVEDDYYLYYDPTSRELRIDPFPVPNCLRIQYDSTWVKEEFRKRYEEREESYLVPSVLEFPHL